jgi:2-polyprenyl-3-methyl-5-hydroxy-6-metoxy-1,4-benzoquinol methylase
MLRDRLKRYLKRLHIRLLGLDGTERFIPKIQGDVPWAAMHFERYRFASLFIRPTDTVTDLACGVGYGTDILSEKGASVVGIDLSSAAVRYAKKNYRGSFLNADLFAVSAQTDVVVSFETVEHVPAPLEKTIGHLLSLAKRTLVASVPYREPAGNNPFHHHHMLSEDHFSFLHERGTVRFFYQEPEPGHRVHETKIERPQNLIIVVHKGEPG